MSLCFEGLLPTLRLAQSVLKALLFSACLIDRWVEMDEANTCLTELLLQCLDLW